MAIEGILRVVDGNVILYNTSGQISRIYYNRGDAFTADWYDRQAESVGVRLKDDRFYIINRSCQIEKRFPNAKGQL